MDSKGKTKRVLLGKAWLFQENRQEIRKLVMIFLWTDVGTLSTKLPQEGTSGSLLSQNLLLLDRSGKLREGFFSLRLLNLKCLQIKDHFSANPGVPGGSPHHEQYTVGASPFTPARNSQVVSRAWLLQIKPLCTFVSRLFFELEGLISLSK